jgi:HD-GYP domain-containing protein (c-di-GMP phosphodiesterase class II)
VSDTRSLLNRIAEFRKRLDAMPRLVPEPLREVGPMSVISQVNVPEQTQLERVEAGSRTQAVLEYSLRQLAGVEEPTIGVPLTHRARRLLADAQGLVARLRAFSEDPLLAGPPADSEGLADLDPVVLHYRETTALVEAAVRFAGSFPVEATDQMRLCDGLEAMLDAARRRLAQLAHAIESRRADVERIDALSRFLVALADGGPLDPAPLIELATSVYESEPGRPLRFLYADPFATRAHLGGPAYREPARFVACHSLNCAFVVARLVKHEPQWRDDPLPPILAALVHDVGMLQVEPATLAHPGPLGDNAKRAVEAHCRIGAEWVVRKMPGLSGLADPIAAHHETLDGVGYPMGLKGQQLSPMARLLAVVDVYAAMNAPRPYRPSFDPRTAMTEVLLLADRGKLDRYAAEKLLPLGFHPNGTVVELSDGSAGVVVTNHDPRSGTAFAKPVVALLLDKEGRVLPSPRHVDLAESSIGGIVRALTAEERRRKLARFYPEWNT